MLQRAAEPMGGKQIILVTGFPKSGKTTLCNELLKYFEASHISNDTVKESIPDILSLRDYRISEDPKTVQKVIDYYSSKESMEHPRTVDAYYRSAVYGVIHNFCNLNARDGLSTIVEANFSREIHNPCWIVPYEITASVYEMNLNHLRCNADKETIINRINETAAFDGQIRDEKTWRRWVTREPFSPQLPDYTRFVDTNGAVHIEKVIHDIQYPVHVLPEYRN